MKSKLPARVLVLTMALSLGIAACAGDDDSGGKSARTTAERIDYPAIGLWDDGACDTAKPPLKIGLMTVFESPVISLKDQATALKAAAKAFNARGGANGACIQVTTCDDGGNIDQSLECVRTIDRAGVVATVNDLGTAGQAEVSAAMADAKIPRIAANVSNVDWSDQNAYPLDGDGTGVTFLLPQALIEEHIKKIGTIRVDQAAASALVGLLRDLYKDEGATFPFDVPVPAGTTDYSQFILGAENAGVGGVMLALGEQEAIQVVRAGEQVNTDLLIGASLGSFSYATVKDLGDFADQMAFLWSYPPATVDLPVYQALRADLGASGDEALQPENLKASPMRSWIGLYALLRMIRDSGMQQFSRQGITTMLKEAKDVPMLNIFGGENWTPNLNHPGTFQRAGVNHYQVYRWDPNATGPGVEGNFVERAVMNFDEVLCGSSFGAKGPC